MAYPYGGINAVSLGTAAGSTLQGAAAIAIGYQAGIISQPASSIVINATGSSLSGVAQNALYIAPIRNLVSGTLLMYDTVNKEVVYSSTLNNTFTANNIVALSTLSASTVSFSTLVANQVNVSTANVSTANVQFVNYSTLTGSTITANTQNVSTVNVQFVNYSSLSGSTINVNVENVSTANVQFLNYSSLSGSTITANTQNVSTVNVQNMNYSSLTGSTITSNVQNVSTANVQFINYSTLTGSTITSNVQNVSTANVQFINYSSLTGSTITTNTQNVSTVNVQFVNYSSLVGSTITTNTQNVSTANVQFINYSSLTGSTITTNTQNVSTVNVQNMNYSTLTGSTITSNSGFVTSTLTVSTLIAANISVSSLALNQFSTLTGSSLIASTVAISTITSNTGFFTSTLTVSTLIAANISVSSLALNQFSTLTGSSLIASTIAISTITSNTGFFTSTLTVSSLIAANISVSSLALNQFSTLTGSSLIASTVAISTITSNTGFFTSTLTVSTLIAANISVSSLALNQFSTLTGSSLIASTIAISTITSNTGFFTSTLTVSTLIAANINVSSLALNQFSTLTGSSLIASTIAISTITSNTGFFTSTLTVSTLIAANISVSSLALNQFSTLTGSSLIASTVAISTITSNTGFFTSTLTVSTLIAANISVSSLALNQFSTLTGSSLIASTVAISTITTNTGFVNSTLTVSTLITSTINTQFMNYSTLTGSTISSNVAYSNLLYFSTLSSINGSTFGNTGPTGPIGQAAQVSYVAPGTQTMAPAGSLAIVNLASTPEAGQTLGITGFTYNPATYLFTNATANTMPISVNYFLSLNTTAGGYASVGVTISGTTTYYGGMYNSSNAFSNTVHVIVPPLATVGLYYMDITMVVIQSTTRFTLTSLQVGQQGATGLTGTTGPTGPQGQASQLSHGVPGTQSMPPSGSLAIVNLASLPDATQSIGSTGFTYNSGTYLFTNATLITIPVSVNYVLSLNVTSGGYSAVGLTISGTTTYYGGVYNINNAVSNTCNILVPPQATVGLYYMDATTVLIQTGSRFTITSLQTGQQGPTGTTGITGPTGTTGPTGPVGQVSKASYTLSANQSIAANTYTVIQFNTVEADQSYNTINFTVVNGVFTNNSGTIFPLLVEYTLNMSNTSGGYSGIGINGSTSVLYGGLYNDGNGISNSYTILLSPAQTVAVYYIDNAATTMYSTPAYAASRVTFTILTAGPQGPTGYTGPTIWSATGSNAPYNNVITYSQGYVGVGPSGTYLQTTRGGATSGTGSTVPQYHLDVAGTVRNSVNMFADNSAMVSATPALDYTTFGQNWTANSLPASGYFGCAMSANGQYQVATLTTAGIYYSSNYGQTWTLLTSGVVFYGISLSASGQYGVACASGSPFNIYISSNYGQTWTSTGQALAGGNGRVAISASGQYITAVPQATGFIYRSSNYGSSWTTAGSSLTWYSVAMSASGQYQVAGTNQASQSCYYSFDYGQTWTASTGGPFSQQLWTLTMSASGQYACLASISSGMYYSSTYGQTWTAASGATSVMTVVAMSASGQYAICASANTTPNYIYYSVNYGQSWTVSSYGVAYGQNWYGCAISANGQYLLAVNASAINAVQSITRFPTVYTNQVQTPLITYADNSAQITNTPALDYNTFGQNWTAITTSFNFVSCAMSANGQYQVGINASSIIYYSFNYGQSWATASTSGLSLSRIAMSASGQYVTAVPVNASAVAVYYSSNYGQTWTATSQTFVANNSTTVCMSASGQYQSFCTSTTGIWNSSNYGITWTQSSASILNYSTICCSASGQYLCVAVYNIASQGIYYSFNYGQTWTLSIPSTFYYTPFQGICMSASGQYVTATLFLGTNNGAGGGGIIYSSNYGQTWAQSTSITTVYTVICAMSASGQYQIAGSNSSGGTNPNSAFYSTNYGVTWTLANTFTTSFYCVAMSANGQYILGSVYATSVIQSITRFPPQSITSQSTTTSTALSLLAPSISGTNNVGIVLGRSITPNNYATIGFQYIGDGSTANYVGIGVTAPSTLCITAGGNVGIGTTVANAPLQFANTVVSRKIVLYEGANNDHQFYGFGINAGVLRYQTQGAHAFYAATSASTSTELMRITETGNVGIGTTPAQPLSLKGTQAIYGITNQSENTTSGNLLLYNNSDSYAYPTITFFNYLHDNSAILFDIVFRTNWTNCHNSVGWAIYKLNGNLTFQYLPANVAGTQGGMTTVMTISTTSVNIPGALSKGSGTFDIEHPLYPNTNKRLVHSFIEGPRCDLIYRGTVALTNGSATVYIDKQCTYAQEDAMDSGTFEALCVNPQYFLQNMSGFNRVVGSIYRGILTITCENNTATDMISWMVVAERKDPFVKNWDRTDSNGYLNTQYTK